MKKLCVWFIVNYLDSWDFWKKCHKLH